MYPSSVPPCRRFVLSLSYGMVGLKRDVNTYPPQGQVVFLYQMLVIF